MFGKGPAKTRKPMKELWQEIKILTAVYHFVPLTAFTERIILNVVLSLKTNFFFEEKFVLNFLFV